MRFTAVVPINSCNQNQNTKMSTDCLVDWKKQSIDKWVKWSCHIIDENTFMDINFAGIETKLNKETNNNKHKKNHLLMLTQMMTH